MKNKTLLTLAIACSPMLAMAHNIVVGQTLPPVEVKTYGEVILQGDDTAFKEWNDKELRGKVRVIQPLAGRVSTKDINRRLMDLITEAKFPEDRYQTTSIINQDDALWGTSLFVKSSTVDSKKIYYWASIVLDKEGNVAKAWQLPEKSSMIIVQDKQGKVLFVKDGELTEPEVDKVMSLIRENL